MDLKQLQVQSCTSGSKFPVTRFYPCYADKDDGAGSFDCGYFYQDLLVAQRVYDNKPKKHVDVASSLYGFVSHVASFRNIEVFDIRPLDSRFKQIHFQQFDLMQINSDWIDYTDSISCLHALEHFGLGRYGDPICFEGHLIGFDNMTKILKQGGKFYLSVPLGEQRIEFHAHRVFSLKYLCDMVTPCYTIDHFSYVDDDGAFHEHVEITADNLLDDCGCHYGVAIFELTKK